MNSPVLQRLLLVRGLRAFADGYVSLLHLPSSIFLVLIPFMPNLEWVIALLLARAALSQMDVPTRSAYVMAIVPPAERAAAASVTAVPSSLAAAIGSLMAGYLLGVSSFGWPLVIAGVLIVLFSAEHIIALVRGQEVLPSWN